MTEAHDLMTTGVRNLDALFVDGLPRGSLTVISGPPGAGKTILTQQICFHNASADRRVLYFNTLSEPSAKTLRHLRPFSFFDAEKLDGAIHFVDLGAPLRSKGLEHTRAFIVEELKRVQPSIVVIDSFKVFDDLAASKEELRKFGYQLAVTLMAWEATTFLLGEYAPEDTATNPLFSIVDGLIVLSQREQSGEQQRFIQIVKMRGTDHSRDEHTFVIAKTGLEIFAPRVTIRREPGGDELERCATGIATLDALLGEGIPRGSSLLVAGVAGTGKTVLSLEFLYRGALAGERGVMFSFEETAERLRASARGLGWDMDAMIEQGMLDIVFIPQPEIAVERDLLMMRERIEAIGARRVAVDSLSVFLHKIKDPQLAREKTFQVASIVQNAHAVGFFSTDIPYGANQISRFGVEETVVDGVVLLSSSQEGLERQRYIEIYKLRNTAHANGRHSMTIERGGISIFRRYDEKDELDDPPPALDTSTRLALGVPGLDELVGGGVFARSVTLVSGSTGTGKTTMALQFLAQGIADGQPGLFVSLEEGPAQIASLADACGLPLRAAIERGQCEVVYLSRERARASHVLALIEERIEAIDARRIVLDTVTHVIAEGPIPRGQQALLHAMVNVLKRRGVTSLFTVEAASLFATETVTEQRLSMVADNIITLRYVATDAQRAPCLSVIKTRGSPHAFGTYAYTIGEGGVRIGDPIAG